jgi:glycosyltransferase involved in cell wall biosynthesis
MRIAIIGSKGIPARSGGIERHVEELAVRLAKRNFDVTVFGRAWYTGPVKKSHKGVRLVQAGSIRTKNLDAITHTFASIIKAMKEDFDVYHFHGVGPSLLAWIPRIFRPNARVVTTFHCIDRKHQKWGFIARRALQIGEWAACRFSHATIVVSKTLAHYCREVYNRDAAYIPNGITPPAIKGSKDAVLDKLGLMRGRYVIMVSRLVRHKGVHTLIEAWKNLKASTEDLKVHGMKLVIVGDGAFTDAYVEEVRAQAISMKDVVFAGFRTGAELDALMSGAAFAVHPSVSEGLPIAVLEEMSYGKAVLATDIPEHLEIIEGKGFTFRAGDVRDLMLQLNWMIQHPRERVSIGAKAKLFVTTYYKWDDVAKETARLYRSLTEKRLRAKTVPATAHAIA